MKTILLYGFLGRQFGRVHRYDVRNAAEAVRALSVTLKGFKRSLIDGGAYRVLIGGREGLDKERLGDPVSDKETIRIVPVVAGAGRGLGQIIVGAALIWASSGTYGWGELMGATAAGIVGGIGVSLVLGGVSQMLFSPTKPKSTERAENMPSFSFDGAVNTTTQGNPVPVFYGGPLIIGSQVVSAGLSAEQI